MRRFALAALCASPVLLSACGDNIVPAGTDDDPATDSTDVDTPIESDPEPDPGHSEPRAIAASLDINSPSCDAATASFEVLARHVDDATFVSNARCHITFDDGATSDLCSGEHTFASAGAHTFIAEVEDLDTGATTRVEVKRQIAVPLTVEFLLDVPACGLEVGFDTTLSTGAEVHVTMSPADKVVEPHVAGRTGTFQVLEPGTYTIQMTAEDERSTGPICGREVSQTVTLTACPEDC